MAIITMYIIYIYITKMIVAINKQSRKNIIFSLAVYSHYLVICCVLL